MDSKAQVPDAAAERPTLLRQLLDGVDPTTLDGYNHLLELVAEYPTMDEERRKGAYEGAKHMASGEGKPHIRRPGDDRGWRDEEEYETCGRYEIELLFSEAARSTFVANLPADQRERLEGKLRRRSIPEYAMGLDRGCSDDGCTMCRGEVPNDVWHVRIWNPEAEDPVGGYVLCLDCVRNVFPPGMPLLDIREDDDR